MISVVQRDLYGHPGTESTSRTSGQNALSTRIAGKAVQVRDEERRDKYRRTLGRVFVEGRDVNAVLVEQGAVWVYRQLLPWRLAIGDQAVHGLHSAWLGLSQSASRRHSWTRESTNFIVFP
ncbi:MAG: thermonuclease family protein [Chthoniobacterales bacterium]|nr:thermonuclease family protein [Chthoniobacterales bacterium]